MSRQFLPAKSKHFPCVLTKCNRVSPRLEVTNVPAVQVNLRHENASATVTVCLYRILDNIRATYYHTPTYSISLFYVDCFFRDLFGWSLYIFMTKETCKRKILAFSRLPRFQHAEPTTSPSCWLFSASQTMNLAAQVGKSANIHHSKNWYMNSTQTSPVGHQRRVSSSKKACKVKSLGWVFSKFISRHQFISLKFGC